MIDKYLLIDVGKRDEIQYTAGRKRRKKYFAEGNNLGRKMREDSMNHRTFYQTTISNTLSSDFSSNRR